MQRIPVFLCLLMASILVAGCQSPIAELDDRDREIIKHILHEDDRRTEGDGRIYFLTTTRMNTWGKSGRWQRLPGPFHESIAGLKTHYRPADQAYLSDGSVFDKGTDQPAWMKWVSILKWESETEVVVESGVLCCPLGGGASTTTYMKLDGQWRIKALGPGWISSR